MDRFTWQSARTVAEAASAGKCTVAQAMRADTDADRVVMKAGGIDLLDLMKEGLLRPIRVINLRDIPGLDTITEDAAGARIGALVIFPFGGASLRAQRRRALLRLRR